MMIDTRPRYRVKENIIAKGYENEITIPYKGKSLEKIFDKGSIVVGQTKNIGGQNIFSVIEGATQNTFDKDTKQPFVGRVEFALDPSKLEIFDAKTEAKKLIEDAVGKGNAPINFPSTAKRTFLDEHKNHLIMIGVPLGFYAFSKYKKYDNKKTAKVTIIGSVVVLGAIVINGLSGMWSGNTIAKRIFGKQNAPPKPV